MNHCDPLSSSSRSNTSIAVHRAFKTQQQFFYSTGATQGLESRVDRSVEAAKCRWTGRWEAVAWHQFQKAIPSIFDSSHGGDEIISSRAMQVSLHRPIRSPTHAFPRLLYTLSRVGRVVWCSSICFDNQGIKIRSVKQCQASLQT